MEWLNYHHLLYFWTVVREGSVVRAAETLRLAQPTVSSQIKTLEETLGQPLFERVGRRMVPTEMGRVVFRYADEIFRIGRELQDTVKGRPTGRAQKLSVGVVDAVPKLVAVRLLEAAIRLPEHLNLMIREDTQERLLAELAGYELDVVIADQPIGSTAKLRGFSHPLGECGVTFFAVPALASTLKKRFPSSLHGAPFLLTLPGTGVRRDLEHWFDAQDIHPTIVGEVEDSALLKTLGEVGAGAFAAPTVIEDDVRRKHGVEVIGRTEEIRERYFAISAERKLKHPAVVAISQGARNVLFRRPGR